MPKEQKAALVLGGSGSIGAAVVKRLTEADCFVMAVGRTDARFNDLLKEAPQAKMYAADCTSEAEVRRCVADCLALAGRLDFVVHTVAIDPDPDTPLSRYPTDRWQRTIATYLTSFFLTFRECLPVMKPKGHILAVSSAVTRIPGNKLPPFFVGHYAASKAGLDELCKWARREAHQRGILLSRIAPSACDVPFHRNAPAYRRAPALLPLNQVADVIVRSLLSAREIDEQMLA
jgi:NAD(P)-dependent dehydrogenase (short-subunit alcohol dehydrogenase family)